MYHWSFASTLPSERTWISCKSFKGAIILNLADITDPTIPGLAINCATFRNNK
jgi:hypothetical protein